jgi:predicted lipoprotein with Yx(FWY)xxD motif
MRLSIRNPLTALAAIVVAAVVLAACGGSDDNGNATSVNASNAGTHSGVVSVGKVDSTEVLADSQGNTLYSADVEKGGQVMCTSSCTSIWKPASASAKQAKSASAQLDLELGTVKRPDGGQQLTFKGMPLYSFTQEGVGQLTGDGVADSFNGTDFVWTSATTGASTGSSESSAPSNSSPY